jgi:hypothetical protein
LVSQRRRHTQRKTDSLFPQKPLLSLICEKGNDEGFFLDIDRESFEAKYEIKFRRKEPSRGRFVYGERSARDDEGSSYQCIMRNHEMLRALLDQHQNLGPTMKRRRQICNAEMVSFISTSSPVEGVESDRSESNAEAKSNGGSWSKIGSQLFLRQRRSNFDYLNLTLLFFCKGG